MKSQNEAPAIAKHTPGEWTSGYGKGITGPTTPRTNGPCCGGEGYPHTVVSKNKRTIAIVPMQENGTMKANAQLIAAAPEMLQICEASLQFFRTETEAWRPDKFIRQIETTIRKARGE